VHAVGIYGASGYAGVELTRILGGHPAVRVAFAASDRWAGKTVGESIGFAGHVTELAYAPPTELTDAEIVFLATPPEASQALAAKLTGRVIDLSHAFRASETAVYGLPELAREKIQGARLVANPGCFPTAASLALGPLLRAKLIEREVIVDALSGVSGAGRRAEERYSLVELVSDARAYQVLTHRHQPEIARNLAAYAGAPVDVTFTPHLIPVARGILATSYARTSATVDRLKEELAGEPFVEVCAAPEDVTLARVVGTNRCAVGVSVSGTRAVVVSAIDNLIKGAAGQAVQNLNIMLGLPEETGLGLGRRLP
jgi:N-acetyl-gamma-glutamyl-phosphate reductase